MRTISKGALCLLLSVLAWQVAEAAEESGESWLDEIATLEAQTQLLQKRDELRSQLEKSSASTLASLPSIVSIMSMDGHNQSQLYFPDGRLSYVKVGDMLRAGVRVARIGPQGVDVMVGTGDTQRMVPLVFVTLKARGEESSSQLNAVQDPILPSDVPDVGTRK